jgi:hypothetical protein
MRALNIVRELFTQAGRPVCAAAAEAPFVCGECERGQRFGLPPDDRCIVMAAQLARGARPVIPACGDVDSSAPSSAPRAAPISHWTYVRICNGCPGRQPAA